MSYSYRIEQAIRAASVLHKDQVRRGDTPFPYVTHLFAVALLVADYTDNEDALVAALLHDTLEDTDYTAEELSDDFGGTVMDIVLEVTEPKHDGTKQNWKERKQAYLKQLKTASQEALIVAAADKIHNMRCIVEEYYDDPARFHADFGGSLDDRVLAYQEMSNIFNRSLTNEIVSEFNHVFEEYKNFIAHAIKESEV